MKQNQAKKPLHFTLHELVVALTYSGTVVRTMFFAFFAIMATVLALTGTDAQVVEDAFGDQAEMVLTYLLNSSLFIAAFGLFDAGYVTASRVLPWSKVGDTLLLVVTEVFILANLFLPVFLPVEGLVPFSVFWLPIVPLFLLSARILIGLLYSLPPKK